LLIALSFIAVWIKWTPNKYLRAKIEKKDIKKFFIKSIPFAFSNIIWIAYFNFDTFMLSLMRSEEEVGTYAAVYRIIGVNYILGYAIVNTFTPKLFRFFNLNRFMFAKIVHKLLSVVITIGIMLSCLLFLFSSFLVPFIVGDSYRNGIIVAQILSIAILFRFINFGLCEVLTTSNQQKYRVQLETVMLLINIIVNYNLIPLLGGEGAAISTVFAEIALLIGCLLICRNKKLLNTPTKAARNLIS
jgi:O-antigen/teichoic acid export membrane protein